MNLNKKKAAFLDRDGVINYDPGNFHDINSLRIFPNVGRAIKLLNSNQIAVIVITNQSVIARGMISENELEKINFKISEIIKKDGAIIDKFYYCPHHPKADIAKYRISCECRKPGIELFKIAVREFNLDIDSSFVVGDSFRDIEAANNLGCRSIGVECGSSDFKNSRPDYKVKDLYEASKIIIS